MSLNIGLNMQANAIRQAISSNAALITALRSADRETADKLRDHNHTLVDKLREVEGKL